MVPAGIEEDFSGRVAVVRQCIAITVARLQAHGPEAVLGSSQITTREKWLGYIF
jgi:hypothetical protein